MNASFAKGACDWGWLMSFVDCFVIKYVISRHIIASHHFANGSALSIVVSPINGQLCDSVEFFSFVYLDVIKEVFFSHFSSYNLRLGNNLSEHINTRFLSFGKRELCFFFSGRFALFRFWVSVAREAPYKRQILSKSRRFREVVGDSFVVWSKLLIF